MVVPLVSAVQNALDPEKAIPLFDHVLNALHRWETYVLFAMAMSLLYGIKWRNGRSKSA